MAIKEENIIPYEGEIKVWQRLVKVGDMWMPVGVGGMFEPGSVQFIEVGGGVYYKCASVNTTAKTWSGNKAVLTDGVYVFEETVTTGLTYGNGFTPTVGKIYNGDATVYVGRLYGRAESMPQENLLLYIPLKTGLNAEIGQALSPGNNEAFSFDTVDGIQCAVFDGTSNKYLTDSNNWLNTNMNQTNSASSYTLSIWAKHDEPADLWDNNLIHFGIGAGLFVDSASTLEIEFLQPSGGSNAAWRASVATSNNRMWHHYAFVRDGGLGKVSVYMDGIIMATIENLNWGVESSTFYIGAHSYGANGLFRGWVTGFRAYTRVLSEDEIFALSSELTPTA